MDFCWRKGNGYDINYKKRKDRCKMEEQIICCRECREADTIGSNCGKHGRTLERKWHLSKT